MATKSLSKARKGKVVRLTDFVLQRKHVEHPSGASVTVPGEAMSLQELLDRAIEGSGMVRKESVFDPAASFDSVDLEKVNGLDLHERQIFIDQLREDVKARIDAVEAERKRKEASQKEKDDLDQEIRSKFKEEKARGPKGQRQAPADTTGKQGGPGPESSGAE